MADPLDIHIETPNYIVRKVRADDDMGNWCEWMDEPATAQMLNAVPRKLTPADFQRANTLSTNIPAIWSLEERLWTLSSRGKADAAGGQGHVELLLYTRSYDVWRSQTPLSDEYLSRKSP